MSDLPAPFNPVTNDHPLHRMVRSNFLDYASYVIRDRAIPCLLDGLKPVQRRVLWALHQRDDGRFTKVANVVGNAMQFHPHGDGSIGAALVVLANKRYLIEGQGNFGNLHTGDPAAASRYIECRLTDLARKEIFQDAITPLVPSYDGRNREPEMLPAKVPLVLMLGVEGIAVGLSTRILPHNFPELLRAQIAILRGEPFTCLPDFQTGGLMDARDYADGRGSIKVRAKIVVKEDSVVIKELPATSTTESIIESITGAVRAGKLKVKAINDYTAESVEIELVCHASSTPDQLVDALYAFTECETTISSRVNVIVDQRPVETTVSEVLKTCTTRLVDLLRQELALEQQQLTAELRRHTLERLFITRGGYKKIELCESDAAVVDAVKAHFQPFEDQIGGPVTDEDISWLLQLRIRRISKFDSAQHAAVVAQRTARLAEVAKSLSDITAHTIGHLERLLAVYGPQYPRLTKIKRYDEVDAKEVAFKAFKVMYDRESGYVGHAIRGEFQSDCTKFDKILVLYRDGRYRVLALPERQFVGKDVLWCCTYQRDRALTAAYTVADGTYIHQFAVGGAIMDRDYRFIPEGATLRFFTGDPFSELFVYYKPSPTRQPKKYPVPAASLKVKHPLAKGRRITDKDVVDVNVTGKLPEASAAPIQLDV